MRLELPMQPCLLLPALSLPEALIPLFLHAGLQY